MFPFSISRMAVVLGKLYLQSRKKHRSVILQVKPELNRSHWSKSGRSLLCSDYRLAKKQRPCELLRILLFPSISRGEGRKEEFFFSSLPEQSLIITLSSSVTVCNIGRDMVKSSAKDMDASGTE